MFMKRSLSIRNNRGLYLTLFLWTMIPILVLVKVPSQQISLVFSINVLFTYFFILKKLCNFCDLSFITNHKYVVHTFYLIFILGFIFVLSFVSREKFIYFWDFSAYWSTAVRFNIASSSDFIASLKQLYVSVLYDDYSLLPTLFTLLPIKIFGSSFTGYVLSIYTVFLFPFYILSLLLLLKLLQDFELLNKTHISIFLVCFLFPAIIAPMLGGYLDSIGIVPIIAIILLIYLEDKNRLDFKQIICLSLLLVFLTLTRRWYSFWVVSFFFSYVISLLLTNLFKKVDNSFKIIKTGVLRITAVGITSLLTLLIFFFSFAKRALLNNFADIYSAYNFGDWSNKINALIEHFGIFILLLTIGGIITGIYNRKLRFITLFLTTQVVLIFILFTRIQSFASHHYYLLSVNIIVLIFVFFVNIVMKFRSRCWLKHLTLIIILILVTTNFFSTFFIYSNPIVSLAKPVLSKFKQLPRIREDIQTLHEIKNDLNKLSSPNKKIYTLSSSSILNDDILRNLDLPESFNAVPNLELTHHVDKRDGFPLQFLDSDIIIVALPFQFHLEEKDQQVIKILAHEVTDGRLSKYYKKINNYEIDNNVLVNVYTKIQEIPYTDIDYLLNEFKQIYPEYPELFKISR